MIYIFFSMMVLIGAFFITEIIDMFRGRKWGENP